MPRYTNPADFLIKLAVDPRFLTRSYTRPMLADINKTGFNNLDSQIE